MKLPKLIAIAATAAAVPFVASAGALFDDIKKGGVIRCGIYEDVPGLASLNNEGKWVGFDVDYCRAMAAAMFGDAEKVEYVKLTFAQGMPAVQSREIDMANLAITYTVGRDATQGFDFVGPTLYSGQGFMVHKEVGATSPMDLDGASICIVAGGITESLIADYFRARNMSFEPVTVEKSTERYQLYENGRCDVVTSEIPFLAIRRSRMADPDAHVILDDLFTKSDMGPVILEEDPAWSNVARSVHYALVTADELGVHQSNIDEMVSNAEDPALRRFLGLDEDIGEQMGLRNDFTQDIVRQVGSYADVWARNFGEKSAMKLPRGLNALARDGGMQWAPTWR